MKKRSLFLSGLLATSLLVGGVLVGCSQGDDNTDTTDPTDNTDTTDTTDTTYKIAFIETNEVEATLSTNEATAGTKVEITIESVPDGYVISSITSDVSGLEIQAESETLYTFNMPESDVDLTINVTSPNIYVQNTGNVPNDIGSILSLIVEYEDEDLNEDADIVSINYSGVSSDYFYWSDVLYWSEVPSGYNVTYYIAFYDPSSTYSTTYSGIYYIDGDSTEYSVTFSAMRWFDRVYCGQSFAKIGDTYYITINWS